MMLMTILEIFIIVEFVFLYNYFIYILLLLLLLFCFRISLSFNLFFFSFSVYTFYGLNLMATFNIVSCFFLSKIYIFPYWKNLLHFYLSFFFRVFILFCKKIN